MAQWDEIRMLFPATMEYTYLNSAGGSPVSDVAAQEGKRYYDEISRAGSTVNWDKWTERRENVRKKAAELIGAENEEIAFTVNTSTGMNFVAAMLRGKGEVITMNDEFPSSTFPWMNLGFRLSFVESRDGIYAIEDIEKKINGKIKILVASHVQYCTGFKQDLVELGKLCKKYGIIFVVNATQSAGAVPIDVKKANIDFLVFAGFKWMMAGHGNGIIYINKKWFGKIRYPVAGWLSVKEPMAMDNKRMVLKRNASALEVGCIQHPNVFALGGAIDLINRIGKENILKRIYELGDYLVEKAKGLNLEASTPLDKKYRSGITIFKMKNAADVAGKLAERKIIVSARGDGLRVSVHVYNNEGDIDRLIDELGKIL